MKVSKVIIFCEGDANSPDSLLLNQIFLGEEHKPSIQGGAGKFGLTNFAAGYLLTTPAKKQKYIMFRDRDFDIQPSPEPKLLQLNRPKSLFLTHRACMENYFLNADFIHNYWEYKYQEKQNNPSSKWGHGDSPGVEEITDWIESAAKSLKDYQAVRWALGNISKSAARKQLKTTWTKGSGELPESLTLSDCHEEALKLIEDFREVASPVNQENFQHKLNEYQTQFEEDKFWTEKQYLIWFQGKDIFREMYKQMQRQGHNYLSLWKLVRNREAIANLDITQHPDLMELKTKLREIRARSPEKTT